MKRQKLALSSDFFYGLEEFPVKNFWHRKDNISRTLPPEVSSHFSGKGKAKSNQNKEAENAALRTGQRGGFITSPACPLASVASRK